MPRPQISLKTLLWLMAVVAAFLGGLTLGTQRGEEDREELLQMVLELSQQNAQIVKTAIEHDLRRNGQPAATSQSETQE